SHRSRGTGSRIGATRRQRLRALLARCAVCSESSRWTAAGGICYGSPPFPADAEALFVMPRRSTVP
ncbi:MAG TPA: hypothetical protein VHE81_12310, partial [Lacipirellulaceae bacterium]|nr:hypothetical protein [Lacipirellulaceae bacterium]